MPVFNSQPKRFPTVKRLIVGRSGRNVERTMMIAGGAFDAPGPVWSSDSTITIPAGFYGWSDDAELLDRALIFNPSDIVITISTPATNTFYSVWAVFNINTRVFSAVIAPGTALTLPAGFTHKKRLPLTLLTDAATPTPKIRPFYIESGWPNQPKIVYLSNDFNAGGSRHLVYSASLPINNWTVVDCSLIIPAQARAVCAYVYAAEFAPAGGGAGNIQVRPNGATNITIGRPIVYASSNPSLYFNWNTTESVIPVANARFQMQSNDNSFEQVQIVVTGFVL